MYERILVPLDGSPRSEGILPYTRALANAHKIPLELLHVIEPQIIATFSDPAHARYADVVEADMRRNGLAYLKTVAASLPNSVAVRCSVHVGNPADAIVDSAAGQAGTLITMATHGRSGIQRWLIGSVADKVLHGTTSHLLLARTDTGRKNNEAAVLKTVIAPLDGSGLAETALPTVVVLAKSMALEIVLVRAFIPPSGALYATDEYVPNLVEITEQARREVKSYLEGKVEQLQAEGLSRVSYVLVEGQAAAEIIDLARKTPDNLVAMSTHGRSGVGRWVLGSVTDRVVRYAGDPVLVIPPPKAR